MTESALDQTNDSAADVGLTAGNADHSVRVMVSPSAGGRIRQIFVSNANEPADTPVELLFVSAAPGPRSKGWGSFPMAPWAGRIRNGRFSFLGDDVGLDLNHDNEQSEDGGALIPAVPAPSGDVPPADRSRHAIHGSTFTRAWDVESLDSANIEMSCSLIGSLGWPFPGLARQSIAVTADHVDLTMSVESLEGSVFPASLGWHPWFIKPDRVDFDPVAMYEQDSAGIPINRLVSPPPGPWDDCFINHQPVRLHYDREVAPTVTVTSPTDHWVYFDGLAHATCVEPQTGPPNAIALRPEVVAPGAPLRITMRISWN